jgi:RimJ/RimL family protein N-acetyltransferase
MSLTVRPVVEADRWRLRDWRNSERIRAMSVSDDEIDEATHSAWFDRLVSERLDEVLIAVFDDKPVGVVSLERLDSDQGVSSWGCHLGVTEVPPGVGALLPLIGLGFGFGAHSLRRMTAEVLSVNRNMRGIHRRLGIPIEGTRREALRRADGSVCDVVEYGVLRSELPEIRATAAGLLPRSIRADADRLLDELAAG